MFVISNPIGILKPNILPTVLDQYPNQKPYVMIDKKGEKVIIDPELTLQRINLWFYWAINSGGFFGLVTSYSARHVGFWLAFLLPGIIYFMLPILLICIKKKLIHHPPKPNEMGTFFRIIALAIRKSKGRLWKKDFWEAAKPSVLAAQGITAISKKPIDWDDKFVDDVQRTMKACVMFLYFPVWTLSNGGIGSVVISMASSLTTRGQPNDVLLNFNPLTIMIFVPLLSQFIYPALQKYNKMPGRITRITFGFFLATISGAIGAVLQFYIYKTSPCGNHATGCRIGNRVSPILVWAQTPLFVLSAMSECFVVVTGCEIAYARSPKNLKAVVLAFFILIGALSSAMAQMLVPVTRDPYLVWIWAGPTIVLAVGTVQFWFAYRWMNSDAFMTYEEEGDDKQK